MKIVVIGTGFVGLTHAAVLAETGHEVTACDLDLAKLQAFESGDAAAIERYVNEPGLATSVSKSLGRRLFFTTDMAAHVGGAEAIFLCVPTPPAPGGSTDLGPYTRLARDLARVLARVPRSGRIVIVNKSTVPIGTARRLQRILADHGVRDVGVASNPEFLAQGAAIQGSRRPDRVVVGADQLEDFEILRRVYGRFVDDVQTRYLETTPETAEAIKYVSNALLLTYVSFWNGVGARLAESFDGVRMSDLKLGVTADQRISTWGSYVGNGAGGSCFGKDIRSLIHQLGQRGNETDLLAAVYDINEFQKTYLLERAVHECGFDFNNKHVAVLGLAFKRNTNDLRDSATLAVIHGLLARGVASIQAYDPLVDETAARRTLDPAKNHLFSRIEFHARARDAIQRSDALFIASDAEEFRSLTAPILEVAAPPYLIIDGRRMLPSYDPLVARGYDCLPVGGLAVGPAVAAQRRTASTFAA